MPFFWSIPTRRLAIAAAVALSAAACGDEATVAGTSSDEPDSAPSLTDRTFWSTAVVIAGTDVDLVDGTRVSVSFRGDQISIDAGCNSMGGSYSLGGGVLSVDGLAMTEMGCDPERHAQDDMVARFFTSMPVVTLEGDTLVAESGDDRLDLLDRDVADPDQAFAGNDWTVTGFFDEMVAWSSAIAEPARLTPGDSNSTAVFDGCASVRMTYELDGTTVTFTGPIPQWGSCDDASAEYAADVRRVLESGPLTIDIQGTNLTLTGADGVGLSAVLG